MNVHEIIVTVVEKLDRQFLDIPNQAFAEFRKKRLDALLAVHPDTAAKLKAANPETISWRIYDQEN